MPRLSPPRQNDLERELLRAENAADFDGITVTANPGGLWRRTTVARDRGLISATRLIRDEDPGDEA